MRQWAHNGGKASCLRIVVGFFVPDCIAGSLSLPQVVQVWSLLLSAQCLSLPRGVELPLTAWLRYGVILDVCVWLLLRHARCQASLLDFELQVVRCAWDSQQR